MLARCAYAVASAVAGRAPLALSRAFSPAARSAAASLPSGHELPFVYTALAAGLTARSFSASAILRAGDDTGVGDGVGVNVSAPAPPAPAGSIKTRVFWVQIKGDVGLAKLVTSAADVGDLMEEIANKLKLTQRTSSLVLQLATEDGKPFTTKAKDADGNPRPVTLSSMDTIDEALNKAATAAGCTITGTDKLRIIVDVAAPAAPAAKDGPIKVVQFVKVRKARVRMPSEIRSEAEFKMIIALGTVSLVKDDQDYTPIRGIWNWADAVAAYSEKQGVLKLDTIAGVAEDMSDLKRSSLNHATGVENATTFAMFHDPTLNEKYGPLRLLNDGRGISIFDKKGKAVMEVDGLVMNTTCVLLNECKTALSDMHVVGAPPTAADPAQDTRLMSEKSIMERALDFSNIVNNIDEYKSNAMDALRVCAGKRVVPVASGFFVSPEAEKACKDRGIELIVPQGSGGTYAAVQRTE